MGTSSTSRVSERCGRAVRRLFASVRRRNSPAGAQDQASTGALPDARGPRLAILARAGAAVVLVAGALAGAAATSSTAQAAASGPCDIYASGGTPCVAAHSTTRALYASYNGPLYQVRRASDNTTRDVGVLSAGGSADAAAQD